MFLGWLDDIGLPQYKDNFNEARVDGRLLHYLTVVSGTVLPVCVDLILRVYGGSICHQFW